MKLIKYLSEIFSDYLPSDLKFDIACRAICRDFEASSATILIYQGKEEILKCLGRYIDPTNAVESYNENYNIKYVLNTIEHLELMDLSERKILDNSSVEKYKQKPLYCMQNRLQNEENFAWDDIRTQYFDYKKVLKSEKYEINTGDSPTIRYYKELFQNKTFDESVYEKIKILYLNRNDKDVSQYYCIKLLEKKYKISLYLGYYIATPLYSKGRIFGVLRIMYPGEKAFIIQNNNNYGLTEEFSERVKSVVALLSSLVDYELFITGYKKALFSTDADISDKNMEDILSDKCELLSEIIQSKGAILRYWDDKTQRWLIKGSTRNLDEYKKYMNDKYKGKDFFNEFDEKFKSNPEMIAVSFSLAADDIKPDSRVLKYIYNPKSTGDVLRTANDDWNLSSILSGDVLKKLYEQNIDKAFIFKLKDFEQSYIVFFNTPTKDFSVEEADIIHSSITNLSIQLHKYDRLKIIRNRLNILANFYGEVRGIVGSKNISNRDYVREFLKCLSKAVKEFKIFEHYFIWQYLSEDTIDTEISDENIREKDALRCISIGENNNTAIFDDNADVKPEKNYYFALDDKALGNLKKPIATFLQSKETIIPLMLKNDWRQLDFPFFDEHSLDEEKRKPVGMITLIYNRSDEWIEKDESFDIFLESCSRQISIAWDKFQELVAEEIEEKINKSIESKQFSTDSSKKSLELEQISGVITDYFDCELCCFFLSDDKNLWLAASSVDINTNLAFDLNEDKNSNLVRSYTNGKNFILIGRNTILSYIDKKLINIINNDIKNKLLSNLSNKCNKIFEDICIQHCISQVIRIGQQKKLGLIILFRIQGLQVDDKGQVIHKKPPAPFSQFESSLFDRIRKHIYNIIFTGRNFKQRMDDLQNVIHQVISPLTAMERFAKNIQQKIYPLDKIDEKLKYLSAQSRMAFYFAQNYQRLLDLERGGIRLSKERINLKSYLIGLAIDYQPMAIEERGISVKVLDSMPENTVVEINRLFFEQVIRNLLHNAVKYSYNTAERIKAGLNATPSIEYYDKENINISAYTKYNKVVIKISNLGLPMSKEERKKMFTREFRGQKAKDKNPVGTGIGCWIAYEIVKLHGGKLELEDSEKDNRFVFKIEL